MVGASCVDVISWVKAYETRTDDTLTEAAGKLFLEDMLTATRRVLDRKRPASRSSSTSSKASEKPATQANPGNSDRPEDYEDDMK